MLSYFTVTGGLDGTTSELSIKGDHVADGASHGECLTPAGPGWAFMVADAPLPFPPPLVYRKALVSPKFQRAGLIRERRNAETGKQSSK